MACTKHVKFKLTPYGDKNCSSHYNDLLRVQLTQFPSFFIRIVKYIAPAAI